MAKQPSKVFAVGTLLLATLWVPLLWSSPGLARAPHYDLNAAVGAFSEGNDQLAKRILDGVLQQNPRASVAARAHVFLGLILLNAIDSDGARREFERAIALDPTVELPLSASPKADVLFRQARRKIATANDSADIDAQRSAAARTPPPAAPPEPESAPVLQERPVPEHLTESAAPSREGPSHLVSYLMGGAAVCAMAAGSVLWFLAGQTRDTITNTGLGALPVREAELRYNTLYRTQYELSEGFFWGGVGLLGAAGGVFAIEALTGQHGATALELAPSVSPTAGGTLLGVDGRF